MNQKILTAFSFKTLLLLILLTIMIMIIIIGRDESEDTNNQSNYTTSATTHNLLQLLQCHLHLLQYHPSSSMPPLFFFLLIFFLCCCCFLFPIIFFNSLQIACTGQMIGSKGLGKLFLGYFFSPFWSFFLMCKKYLKWVFCPTKMFHLDGAHVFWAAGKIPT